MGQRNGARVFWWEISSSSSPPHRSQTWGALHARGGHPDGGTRLPGRAARCVAIRSRVQRRWCIRGEKKARVRHSSSSGETLSDDADGALEGEG